jgi:DNA replication and repair protein RecF
MSAKAPDAFTPKTMEHTRQDRRLWVERIALTNFRSYTALSLDAGPRPQVLIGPNGAGKTNLLEAVSLLSSGQGLRRAEFSDLPAHGGNGSWAVAARVHTLLGPSDIGTGSAPQASERSGRVVRVDGTSYNGSGVLADYVEMVWMTPAMDGLFTGPAAERRRFLDRLILCFDPTYRTRAGRFERAMQQRNRLLADGVRDEARFSGLELQMAEMGVAIAASRLEAIAALANVIATRRARDPQSPFPWSELSIDGTLEAELSTKPAVDAEDAYAQRLASGRERDRAAGRTLEGPHRSDLVVGHGPKSVPGKLASTGEQKALLMGLVLAHAELISDRHGFAPILLLDEVTAHLDEARRAALFAEILHLGAQAWMTGTDARSFAALADQADFRGVEDGAIRSLDPIG